MKFLPVENTDGEGPTYLNAEQIEGVDFVETPNREWWVNVWTVSGKTYRSPKAFATEAQAKLWVTSGVETL